MPDFTYALPGLQVQGHRFQLPLDYARPQGETISVFAREVVAPDKLNADLPYLIFFQGGRASARRDLPGQAAGSSVH